MTGELENEKTCMCILFVRWGWRNTKYTADLKCEELCSACEATQVGQNKKKNPKVKVAYSFS